MTLPDKDTLATEFAIIIREWLTPEQCQQIDAMNAAEQDKSICHSHDFCDSNQAMIDALGRFNVELDLQDEKQVNLINSAWDIAKASGFSYGG